MNGPTESTLLLMNIELRYTEIYDTDTHDNAQSQTCTNQNWHVVKFPHICQTAWSMRWHAKQLKPPKKYVNINTSHTTTRFEWIAQSQFCDIDLTSNKVKWMNNQKMKSHSRPQQHPKTHQLVSRVACFFVGSFRPVWKTHFTCLSREFGKVMRIGNNPSEANRIASNYWIVEKIL